MARAAPLHVSISPDQTPCHDTNCGIAAIASGIALGSDPAKDIPNAVEMAVRYVEAGIKAGVDLHLGHGSGPINHFHSLSMRLSPPYESSLRRSIYGGMGACGVEAGKGGKREAEGRVGEWS